MSNDRNYRKKLLLITAVTILIFCLPNYIYSQEIDAIPIPLYINETYTGELSVIILPDETVQIRPSELITHLEELMSVDAIQTARLIFPETGWLDMTDLAGLGVRILFKFEDLTIHITIPAHLQREIIVSFKGVSKEPAGEYIDKANFSAFLNIHLWNRFTYETLGWEFSATPEIGLNIFDWVTEVRGGIHSGGTLWFLDYARLVKDFTSIGYRLEVGDLTMPIMDLTGVSKLLGASFRKNNFLPSTADRPSPYTKEIFIREPSKVEIYMNDRKVREKNYSSGSYIFRDFPLTRGVNKISIRWVDSDGEHEEGMVIPFDGNLLNAGEFDLGAAAGLPDRAIILPAISSYQYLGITDNFTFGITESFNIDTLEFFIHPDLLLSTSIGSFNLIPIWGISFNGGQKIDTKLGYQLLKPGNDSYLNFGINLNYSFDSISSPELPLSMFSLDGYYNFDIGSGFSFTPEASWGWKFDENRQIINTKAILRKGIRGGSSLSANLGLSYDSELIFSATITFSTSFPDLNQNLYLMENLGNQRLSAYWTRYPKGEKDFSLNAAAEVPMKLDDKLSLGLSGGYIHPQFRIDGGQDFNTIIESSEIHNSTYLSASSGLAYADGYFMITKPVNDSFIIVAPGSEFDNHPLKVNPNTGGSELELKGKAGIMSGISSFKTYKIYVEPEELPEGMDDAGMKYLVRPSYKSAFVVKPQADILIFIGGLLKDSDGQAVETALGRLTGKNSGESVDFFTDENGYFEAYSLAPDIYTLQLNGFDQDAYVDLTQVESGFHDAGTITLKEE